MCLPLCSVNPILPTGNKAIRTRDPHRIPSIVCSFVRPQQIPDELTSLARIHGTGKLPNSTDRADMLYEAR